jgi:hypothetical protein
MRLNLGNEFPLGARGMRTIAVGYDKRNVRVHSGSLHCPTASTTITDTVKNPPRVVAMC